MSIWIVTLVMLINGAANGLISVNVRRQLWRGWQFLFTTSMSCGMWWLLAKTSHKSLSYASIVFDVSVQIGYFTVLLLCGERIAALSACGIVLAIVGIGLMSLQG